MGGLEWNGNWLCFYPGTSIAALAGKFSEMEAGKFTAKTMVKKR